MLGVASGAVVSRSGPAAEVDHGAATDGRAAGLRAAADARRVLRERSYRVRSSRWALGSEAAVSSRRQRRPVPPVDPLVR